MLRQALGFGVLRKKPVYPAPAPAITPQSFSGLVFWGRPSALAGADGSSVATWTDQNGGTGATGVASPVLKRGVLGGSDAIRFDGSTQYFSANHLSSNFANGHAFSIIAVHRFASLLNPQNVVGAGNNSENGTFIQTGKHGASNANYAASFRNSGFTITAVDSGVATDTAAIHAVALLFNGSAMSIFKDGTKVANAIAVSSSGYTITRVGIGALLRATAANFFNGDIGDLLIYDNALSDANYASLYTSYLKNNYTGLA